MLIPSIDDIFRRQAVLILQALPPRAVLDRGFVTKYSWARAAGGVPALNSTFRTRPNHQGSIKPVASRGHYNRRIYVNVAALPKIHWKNSSLKFRNILKYRGTINENFSNLLAIIRNKNNMFFKNNFLKVAKCGDHK